MDDINLKLPAKPEYVSVARLTTAAIANRLGFNVDEIEDLKVAVSEAGIYLINQFIEIPYISIDYHIHDSESIKVNIRAVDASGIKTDENKENELSLFIIESVVDKVFRETDQDVVRGFSIYKSGGSLE